MADREWGKKLTGQEYHILREKGTEPAFSGEHLHNRKKGTYSCKACGNVLFKSDEKYDSGSGWPSFFDVVKDAVELKPDLRLGMERTEVLCNSCGSHLGHLFEDGPQPTGKRYCVNSLSLDFIEK